MATIATMHKRYGIKSLTIDMDHITKKVMFKTQKSMKLHSNPFSALKAALQEDGLAEDTVLEIIRQTQKDTVARAKVPPISSGY